MSYNVNWLPNGGLHPQLSLTIAAPPSSCPLYLHLPLPPSFIPDRFQLAQLHAEGRLGAHSPTAATLQVDGSRDLESPVTRAEGASLSLRLRHGKEGKGQGREEEGQVQRVEIPLHLRYQLPVAERWTKGGERADRVEVLLEWPWIFWACREGQDPPPTPSSCPTSALPLSSLSLPSRSILHFLTPLSTSTNTTTSTTAIVCPPSLPPPLTLPAPTGVLSDLPLVERLTFVVVWLGMAWIARGAFEALNKRGKRRGKARGSKARGGCQSRS